MVEISKREIILGGLNCAHCSEVINDKVSKLEEVKSCNLNFINKKLTVEIISKSEMKRNAEAYQLVIRLRVYRIIISEFLKITALLIKLQKPSFQNKLP